MMRLLLCAAHLLTVANTFGETSSTDDHHALPLPSTSKPYTRWWWFASEIDSAECRDQLDWLASQGFGGVEIAFIYPPGRDPEASRLPFLGPDWSAVVAETKRYADSIGLGCDFTFGTLWPFGGSFVPDADRTRIYGDPDWRQSWRLSWEHGTPGNVLNHLDSGALERYASRVGGALEPALKGSTSALFCDSWEVESRRIWTEGFGDRFEDRFGYRIEPFMDTLYESDTAGPRYDYMTLVSDTVLDEFFRPFTRICHELNAVSRVQCAGAPADILAAYAAIDIPESEAMLYEPGFARIPASAAAIASRPLVSAESFTCLYGFPGEHIRQENVFDLKRVADALFANGVNHIVWHGMPFNNAKGDENAFYATVHVGREGSLSSQLRPFNAYMEKISAQMRRGKTYTDVAVYLPLEDAWIEGEYPEELQMKWSWGAYEMRYVRPAPVLHGRHPMWVTGAFLHDATFNNGRLYCGDADFSSLYVDVRHLDGRSLDAICRLAQDGLPVVVVQTPREPGHLSSADYDQRLEALLRLPNVVSEFDALELGPALIQGEDLPEYWCRQDGDELIIFLAHPDDRALTLPLEYEGSMNSSPSTRRVTISAFAARHEIDLTFGSNESLLLHVGPDGVKQTRCALVLSGP